MVGSLSVSLWQRAFGNVTVTKSEIYANDY